MELTEKLRILSDAAKYDVSCSSSGSYRKAVKGGLGSAASSGICHSFTPDGRCISLLKILLTNCCIYDCAYCINRRSNDVERASFTVDEVISLTINFYRRNYIEGLFLSSAIIKNADHTMEMLRDVVKKLRLEYGFNGYIHLKAIPGADEALITDAGRYADRMSVNIELPSQKSLKLLAPDKKSEEIFKPMETIKNNIIVNRHERAVYKNSPLFVPGGQSTQLIVGASSESDMNIMNLSENLYNTYSLKRIYYSAYVPINHGKNLPQITQPPTLREHRLYQGDWLLRKYGFKASELLSEKHPDMDVNFDPKTNWALNNIDKFPVEINSAPYSTLIRVPGIGIKGARKIVNARRTAKLNYSDLKILGITLKRAQYFILCDGKYNGSVDLDEIKIRTVLAPKIDLKMIQNENYEQLSFFDKLNGGILKSREDFINFDKTRLLEDKSTYITGEI